MNIIYVYEGIDIMFSVLNFLAIENPYAMWSFFIQSIGITAVVLSFFRFIFFRENLLIRTIVKYSIIWIIIPIIMHPGDSIIIVDRVTDEKRTVENVPRIISIIITPLEHFSHIATNSVKSHLTPASVPTDTAYQMYYGMRLKARYKNIKINDGCWRENISNFFNQCVMNSLAMRNFSISDFRTSENSWQFLEGNLNDFFTVDIKSTGATKTLSCRNAAKELKKISNSEIKNIIGKNLNFGQKTNIKESLNRYLALNAGVIGDVTYRNFNNIVLWNELQEMNDAYADSRIRNQYMSSNYFANQNISMYLPIVTTIFKSLSLILIPFMMIIYILTLNPSAILGLLNFLIAIYLTEPISEIFNIIILTAWHNTIHGITLNYNNFLKVANEVSPYVVVGMSLKTMVLPFCWALTSKLGLGQGMVQLAGNMMHSAVSASSNIATEMSSGNISMGNKNIGNEQLHNHQGFQVKNSPNTDVAGDHLVDIDGARIQTTGAGNPIYDMTQTQGRGLTTVSQQELLEYTYNQGKATLAQEETSLSKQKIDSISKVESQAIKFADSISKTFGVQEGTQIMKEIRNSQVSQEAMRTLEQDSANIGLSAEAKMGIAVHAGIVSGSASVGIHGSRNKTNSKTNENTSSQSIDQTSSISNTLQAIKNNSAIMAESKELSSAMNQTKTIQLAESENFRKQTQLTKSYNESKKSGYNLQSNVTDSFVKSIAKKWGMSEKDVWKNVDSFTQNFQAKNVAGKSFNQKDSLQFIPPNQQASKEAELREGYKQDAKNLQNTPLKTKHSFNKQNLHNRRKKIKSIADSAFQQNQAQQDSKTEQLEKKNVITMTKDQLKKMVSDE